MSHRWRRAGTVRLARVLFLVGALVVPLAGRAAADVGGDDVRIARGDGALHSSPPSDLRLGVSAGDLYAAGWGWSAPAGPRVYRSADGGTHWTEWGVIDDWSAGHFDALIAEGTPARYVHARYSAGLKVQAADLSGASASWTVPYLIDLDMSYYAPPSLACRTVSGAPADVYLAYVADNLGPEVRFTRSTDGGLTFASPIVLQGSPIDWPDHEYWTKVVSDAGNRVRVVWSDLNTRVGTEVIHYRDAVNGGATIADWASPAVVDSFATFAYVDASVSFAAAPGSNDLLVAAHEHAGGSDDVRLYFSGDGGTTWDHFDTVSSADAPDLAWGGDGPALGCYGASDGQDYYLARPSTSDVTSPWVAEKMLSLSPTVRAVGIAFDPTRGNQCAMVGWSSSYLIFGDSDEEMWFDAEWRTHAGYGVSEPGTPVDVGSDITSAPAIADLDADGDLDIMFTRADSTVAAFDVPSATLTTLGFVGPTSAASAPVVANAESTGPKEIFVGTDAGVVAGLDATGAALPGWPVDLGTGQPVHTSCGAITGATRIEIVAASGRKVWVLRPDGSTAPGFPVIAPPAWGDVVGRVAVGDVDASGDQDLVAAYEEAVVILDDDGSLEKILHLGLPVVSAGVSLGDVDDDGDLEIAIPYANGMVGLRHHTGAGYGAGWPFTTGASAPIGPIAIAQSRDAVTAPQFHFLNGNGEAYYVDNLGNVSLGFPQTTSGGSSLREPVIQHLGPGSVANEILVGSPTGYAHAWDVTTGQETTGWRRDVWFPVDVAGAAADLDDDGNVEAVIPAGSWLWVLDMGVAPAIPRRTWTQAGGNFHRDACWDCPGTAPTGVEEVTAPAAFSLEVGPNPSRGAVTLRFMAPEPVRADVEILDVAGRRVRRVARGLAIPERGSLVWDGCDESGRITASGVYWARARLTTESGDRFVTRRITRVR